MFCLDLGWQVAKDQSAAVNFWHTIEKKRKLGNASHDDGLCLWPTEMAILCWVCMLWFDFRCDVRGNWNAEVIQ